MKRFLSGSKGLVKMNKFSQPVKETSLFEFKIRTQEQPQTRK